MSANRALRAITAFLVLVSGIAAASLGGTPQEARADDLNQRFVAPPDADRPWVYWWWLNGNVTEASIRSDLAAMKEKGIGGFLLFDARGYHDDHVPPPPVRMEFMSPQWRAVLKLAMAEANRLGLAMSVNLSSCAGALKGPWDVGDDAPKQLVWATEDLEGPQSVKRPLPAGDWKHSWDVALLACRHAQPAAAQAGNAKPVVVEVVDLADKIDAAGQLVWQVPEGRWTLLRLAATIMEGRQTEVDILSAEAITNYFNRMGKAILDDAGPLAGKTLTHFYSVSWEGAAPTWTLQFEREFEKRRGYALRSYLPVLAGMTVRSAEISQRLLEDYRRTVGDCFRDNCYGTLRTLCHQAGLQWHSESGGPWDRKNAMFAESDQLAFWARNDMPQGEFWWPNATQTNARRTAMAAHIYGTRLAAIEAFTHMTRHWSAYPAALKPRADAVFCDGINRFIWHTFTASPPEFGKPGVEYFAGTHLNPNVTWWPQAGEFLTYLARGQQMLRQGRFVADVCCYTSDRNYAGWTRGEKWSDKPSLALPKGYAYDLVNTEVLRERMSVRDGRLVLPDGMSYRLLVVDLAEEALPPEALKKIRDLVSDGATVVLGRRRPGRAPGLNGYPACDDQVRQLAKELWGEGGNEPLVRPLGKGRVVTGTALDAFLATDGVLPDFESILECGTTPGRGTVALGCANGPTQPGAAVPQKGVSQGRLAGPWDYIHRRSDDADVYFVAGQGDAECVFRVTDREPGLWDPVSGHIRDAVQWRATPDGRTIVPIHLAPNGSTFVVFRHPASERHLVAVSGPARGLEVLNRTDRGIRLRLWQRGKYTLETSPQGRLTIAVDQLTEPRNLEGPWQVRFAPGWGAPASVNFDRLVPWNEHPDVGIKYFSGTATYHMIFELDQAEATAPLRLQLGRIGHVAELRLGGKRLGVVWTDPWTVDLTGVVKAGANELEIDVTNVWQNRLIGDAALPEPERRTKTNIRLQPGGKLKAYEGYTAQDSLVPSGLMGPVRLEFGQQRDVEL